VATPGGTDHQVSLVFSDLKGSTALAERLDAETLRVVLTRYFDEMRAVFESHGGEIAKIIGDAIVAVFDASTDAATAALGAVRASVEAQAVLDRLNDRFDATWGVRLQSRSGVATGRLARAVDGTEGTVLAGDVVVDAETLEAAAPAMETLADAATLALAGDVVHVKAFGTVPRKRGSGTIEAWHVVAVDTTEAVTPSVSGATRACPECGFDNERDARRCAQCSTPLAAADAGHESRRMVTIVFADVKAARADGSALDADTTRAVMEGYFAAMRPILERHGGTVEKFIGDALMAVFGLPVRHEDDALRAVRAANDMRHALAALNEQLDARFGVRLASPIGINTGTVVAGDAAAGERLVTGDAVNVAARLEQTAADGEVVLGDSTRRLVGDAVETELLPPLTLKGKSEPVPAHRLVRVSQTTAGRPRHEHRLVGRDRELDELRGALRACAGGGRAQRITLIGDAGVGKSRLTHEFLGEARREARVVQGNCLAYGDGITFWPLLRVVQDAAGIEEDDDADTARARIAALLPGEPDVVARLESLAGLSTIVFAIPELVWAFRRLLERLAGDAVTPQPVVVVLDDIHWAEPAFLEAVDELTTTVRAPVTLLCTARPSLGPDHRAFVDGAPAVTLEPLTDEDCERFLRLLLGGSDIDPRVVRHIVDAAGGNPLFIEQLWSMLIDEGRVRDVGGQWQVVGSLSALQVPASIEALLAARLDLLARDERRVIEPASVIGRRFAVDAVTHLVEADLRPEVDDRLQDLHERELVNPAADDEPAFHFQHQLIRDATYAGLLKETRAILHERFATWADARNRERDRAAEFEEIQGYHFEQAYRYWRELGPLDSHAIAIGERASQRLASAGDRSLRRGDMRAAANLLTRAADMLAEGHPARPHILLRAGNALHETGSFDEATAAYDASVAAGELSQDTAAAEAARIERLRLHYLIGRVDDPESVPAAVDAAIALLEAQDDADALSRAWQLRLNVDIAACQWSAAQRAADQVIRHARRAGNGVLEVRTMPLLAFLAQKGPMPVADATAVCREILERVAFDRRSTSLTQLELALLSAMALDVDEARRSYTATRRVLGELGWEMQGALVSLSSGPIELAVDEAVRAEAELRQDYDTLQRLGEQNFITLTAVLLAEAVYRQRRFDEARSLVTYSRELAAPDDLAVQILVRSVEGKLAARAGDTSTGVQLTREALAMIEMTEDPSGQGDAHLDLAETLWLAGASDSAAVAATAAAALYEEKGNRAGTARAAQVAERIRAGRDPLA
jgi:class 3 adenylate cyclase